MQINKNGETTMKTTTKKETLFDIISRHEELFNALEQALLTGDEKTMLETTKLLDITQEDLLEKADAYAAVIDQKKAEAQRLKEKATEFTRWANRELAQVNFLKDKIDQALKLTGLDKLQSEYHKFWYKPTKTTEIENESLIPEKFKTTETVTVTKIDKNAIKKAIANEEIVPGAKVVDHKHLQIK